MTVHSSQIGGTAPATAALKSTSESRKSAGTSFSAVLKDASTTAESTTSAKKAPAGEKTRAVDGHKYVDVVAGPRKGMYINTGSNTRSGEAFVMVKKNGREYHIYGTGENRRVIGLKPAGEKNDDALSGTGTSTGTTDPGKINTDASTTS
jgi:hypothetical protein